MGPDWGFRSVSDRQYTADPRKDRSSLLLLLRCFLLRTSYFVLLNSLSPLLFCRVVASEAQDDYWPQGPDKREKKPQFPTAGGGCLSVAWGKPLCLLTACGRSGTRSGGIPTPCSSTKYMTFPLFDLGGPQLGAGLA